MLAKKGRKQKIMGKFFISVRACVCVCAWKTNEVYRMEGMEKNGKGERGCTLMGKLA